MCHYHFEGLLCSLGVAGQLLYWSMRRHVLPRADVLSFRTLRAERKLYSHRQSTGFYITDQESIKPSSPSSSEPSPTSFVLLSPTHNSFYPTHTTLSHHLACRAFKATERTSRRYMRRLSTLTPHAFFFHTSRRESRDLHNNTLHGKKARTVCYAHHAVHVRSPAMVPKKSTFSKYSRQTPLFSPSFTTHPHSRPHTRTSYTMPATRYSTGSSTCRPAASGQFAPDIPHEQLSRRNDMASLAVPSFKWVATRK